MFRVTTLLDSKDQLSTTTTITNHEAYKETGKYDPYTGGKKQATEIPYESKHTSDLRTAKDLKVAFINMFTKYRKA